jgi:beta-ketoacyl-acyl-carrier-protein synthase II
MHRVAITGLGVITSLGTSVDEFFTALVAGRSGVRRLAPAWSERLRSPIAAAIEFDGSAHFSAPRLRMFDRVTQLALVAVAQAISDAKLEFRHQRRERCGVCVGTGVGGAETTEDGYHTIYAERSERVKPYSVLAAMNNAAAAWIGIDYGLSGPNLTYSTACSSSAVAIGEAARRIQCGDVDVMLAGGAEAPLTFGVLRAWEAMRTLALPDPLDPSSSCRPFSRTRTGLVLGEGAAFVALEEWDHAVARGAAIHAELSGYGLTTDADHITRPTAEGQAGAMRAALDSARLQPDTVDYINAHGTGTTQNDVVETEAIKKVFGRRAYRLPVSSTKSMHAHLLGAAGALEFVVSVMCLRRSIVPPTMHLDSPDAACDLDYVAGQARTGLALRTVMSNSFAFGGTNAVLIARTEDA